MQESKRTLIFVAVGILTVGLASMSHLFSKPAALAEFERVGEEFYPKFDNPNNAASLEVTDFSEDKAEIRKFSVEFSNGAWRIPSRHNYPADAKDQLAKTATSIIGLKREALAGRRPSDHKKFSVLDPLTADATVLEGLGQRLTIKDAKDKTLADYIIGKSSDDGTYYVRAPEEKETYRVHLNIDLSTKFADWIEPDLLKLDRYDLRKIIVDKYSIDESNYTIVGKEVSELTNDKKDNTWKLTGLDEATEELKTQQVNDLVSALDELKIVGVRPKPEGLRPDLSVDPKIAGNPLIRNSLAQEMAARGFLLARGEDGSSQLVSNEGEVIAGTDKGVSYTLHFGEIFSGDEKDIEVGGASKKGDDSKDADAGDEEKTGDDADAQKDDAEKEEDESSSDLKRSRYLFVRVTLDKSLLGDAPVEPTQPEKPAGLKEEQPASEEGEKEKAEGDEPAAETDEAQQKLQQEYDEALKTYELELGKYKRDKDEYDKKIADGKKKVDDLSHRFNEWYYVISAESFEKLQLSRADLVQPKTEEKVEPGTESATPTLPTIPTPTSDDSNADEENADKPEADSKPEEESKPDADSKPEATPAGESAVPEEESKPAEAEETSPEGSTSEQDPSDGTSTETEKPATE